MSADELLTWFGSAGSACSGDAGFLLLGLILICTTLGAGGGGGGWLFDEDDAGTSSLGLSTEWGLTLTFNFFNCCTSC